MAVFNLLAASDDEATTFSKSLGLSQTLWFAAGACCVAMLLLRRMFDTLRARKDQWSLRPGAPGGRRRDGLVGGEVIERRSDLVP